MDNKDLKDHFPEPDPLDSEDKKSHLEILAIAITAAGATAVALMVCGFAIWLELKMKGII